MKKKQLRKQFDIYSINFPEDKIRIRARIDDVGNIYGTNYFEIRDIKETKKKQFNLMHGKFEDDSGYWRLSQLVNWKGNVIGIGSFRCFDDRKYNKDKARKHILHTDNRYISGLNKREHPGKCEICNTKTRLYYHHWDNNNYSKGMWLCMRCHLKAECLEKMITEKFIDFENIYLIKKDEIDKEFENELE